MSAIRTLIIDGYNKNAPENFENIAKAKTIEDIQSITRGLLEDSKSHEVVFKPEM